jgi:hypothetical protein
MLLNNNKSKGINPLIALVKEPVPLIVFVVICLYGFGLVVALKQHLALIIAPPSDSMLPT